LSPSAGDIIYNTTTSTVDYYNGASWLAIASGGANELNDLTDVTTGLPGVPTAADDGKLLFYNFSTGQWESDDSVTFGTTVLECYSGEVGAIDKGTPVYLTGVFDADVHEVKIADADGAGTYPVVGFASESLPTSSATPGKIIKFGKLQGVDTSGTSVLNADAPTAWVAGDDLYLSTTPGKLTVNRPTGGATAIQRVAKVLRVDATSGQLLVFNTNRTAGLPNLSEDNTWKGDANGHPQPFKHNFAATVAPTATDDSAAGYEVGSRWIDTVLDNVWVCVDATATAAIWRILDTWYRSVYTYNMVTSAAATFN
jgi:hypothetical protein